ncbi:MAG: DUF5676 family membrane protein [Patescibacteria group bacterium]
MLNAKAFANATMIVAAVFYLICLLLSYVVPDLLFSIINSWIHSLNIESLQAEQTIFLTSAALGFFSITLFTWVTTYATIILYNSFYNKK